MIIIIDNSIKFTIEDERITISIIVHPYYDEKSGISISHDD